MQGTIDVFNCTGHASDKKIKIKRGGGNHRLKTDHCMDSHSQRESKKQTVHAYIPYIPAQNQNQNLSECITRWHSDS